MLCRYGGRKRRWMVKEEINAALDDLTNYCCCNSFSENWYIVAMWEVMCEWRLSGLMDATEKHFRHWKRKLVPFRNLTFFLVFIHELNAWEMPAWVGDACLCSLLSFVWIVYGWNATKRKFQARENLTFSFLLHLFFHSRKIWTLWFMGECRNVFALLRGYETIRIPNSFSANPRISFVIVTRP